MSALGSLLKSRKVLITIWTTVQTIVLHFWTDMDLELIAALDGLVMVLIASIAAEDAAAKSAGKHPSQNT